MAVDGLASDVRVALRQMKWRSGLSAAIILTLAFGIGLNTAVFSALDKVALNPLPYRDPNQLVAVHNRFAGTHMVKASPFDYLDLREHRDLFSDVGIYYFLDLNRTGVQRPEKVSAIAISSDLFRVLDVRPLLGRAFTPEEQKAGGPHVVMIGEAFWRSDFPGDAEILGRALQLNGETYEIVGVMPKSFAFPNEVTQMWVPLSLRPKELADPAHANFYLRMYGRLAPGVHFDEAAARIAELSRQMAATAVQGSPRARQSWQMFLVPMASDDDGSLRRSVEILFGSVCCLLLIVCSNVAGLLLVRSHERRFELAMRMALGASRARLARQMLTEAGILAITGGLIGFFLAKAGVVLLNRYGPVHGLSLNSPALWFCAGLTVVTGLLCSVYPAWIGTHDDAIGAMKDGGGQRTQRRGLWQKGLIVAQIGTATTLLIAGALLIQSLIRLLETPLGFDARDVTTFEISLPPERYTTPESRAAFWRAFTEKAAATPGVKSVSAATLLPFGYGENVNVFEIVGRGKPATASYADFNEVLPGYFKTMRIPLLRGRTLTDLDATARNPVTVVDQTLAQRFFAGENPVGQRIRMPWGTFTIVGVVGSVKVSGLDIETPPTLYLAAAGQRTDYSVIVRTSPGMGGVVNSLRDEVALIDRDQPIYDIFSMDALVKRSLKARRFVVWLMVVFGSAGATLSALGLYGLLSYTVLLRRREIGIRMAVGADGPAIATLICRGGLALIVSGIAAGSAAALATSRLIQSQLYGTRLADGATWIGVLAALTLVGLLACALPAWRAARMNPVDALRLK